MNNRIREHSEDFLQYCRLQRRLSENSIQGYAIDLRMFMEYLEGLNPPVLDCCEVTKKTLEDYLAVLTVKYKVKTIKRKMACIHSFFSYLEDREVIADNPFLKFRLRLREGHRNPQSLSIKEIDHFLKTAYADEFAIPAADLLDKLCVSDKSELKTLTGEFFWCRDIAILELLFAVGLRVAELCGLRFEDYNEVEHSFYIIGKGNRERMLYLENAQVLDSFNNYLRMRKAVQIGHSYIFITRFRDRMSTQGVRNMVRKYATMAGINKKITPHVFRHSFATLLLESGVDIKYIQDFLGHSTISTTQIYLHLSDENKRKILATKHPRELMSHR